MSVDDMRNHPILGYVEEMAFAPELNDQTAIAPNVELPFEA
jgi:hypothetical protein